MSVEVRRLAPRRWTWSGRSSWPDVLGALVVGLGCVIVAALIVMRPVAAVFLLAGVTLFVVAVSAPGWIAFGLLGFLAVFDGLFFSGLVVRGATIELPGISPSTIVVAGVVVRLLNRPREVHAATRTRRATIVLCAALMAAAAASSLVNGVEASWRDAITVIGGPAVILVVAFAAPRDVLATVKGLFTGAFLLMVTGIAAVLTAGSGTPLVGTARVTIDRVVAPVPRITGVLSSPNHLALVLVVGAFLSLLLGRTRLTRLAGFLVFLVAVPFTYSRGGILGAVAGVVTFVLLCLAFSPRTRRGAGTALLIGVFAVIFAVGVYAGLRWAVGQDVWNQRAVEIRERIAPLAFSTGLSHPVLGIGPGQFLSPAWFQVEAHDTYLQAFAEIGIVGLAGVSLLAVLALVTTIRTTMGSTTAESVRHGAALAAIVVAVTLQAATLTLTGLKVFWLVLALGLFYEADRTAGPAAGRPPGGVRVPAEHHST